MIHKILERVWKNSYKSLFLINTVCVDAQSLSPVQVFVTLWTVAHQAPLSMGFSRQEYWSGLPCPPLGDVPYPGVKPVSPASPALAGGFFTTEPSGILAGGKNIVHKLFVITFECYTSISDLPWWMLGAILVHILCLCYFPFLSGRLSDFIFSPVFWNVVMMCFGLAFLISLGWVLCALV